mmetsp:Transcript_7121/g.25365  ORF Transcript_7121/g.25365 Transcript_7121/m.25365 type:complete len:765 (-) Transcript_7121:79-2373(-)
MAPAVRVRFTVHVEELHEHCDDTYRRAVAIIGSAPQLGAWSNPGVRMRETSDGVWQVDVELPIGEEVTFKYIQLRKDFPVTWETIPGGRTVVPRASANGVCEAPRATYGRLPDDHPKRRGGTSMWVDSHLLTPEQGAEIRIHIGSYSKRPGVQIERESRPLSLRMRFVAHGHCEAVSATGGHVKARLERWMSRRDDVDRVREDEAHGHVPYTPGDVVVFKTHADIARLRAHRTHGALLIDVLAHTDGHHTGEALEHIGQSIVTMDTFVRSDARTGAEFISRGSFALPILRVGDVLTAPTPIGHLYCEFVVVTPFKHPASTLERTWRRYWTKRGPLDIGHRGKGRSFADVEGQRRAIIKENTIVSFTTAGLAGAEYVELDVMLTKDRVPIIYHDFHIAVEADLQTGFHSEPVAVAVDQLTLEQLKELRTGHVHAKKHADGDDTPPVEGGAAGGSGGAAARPPKKRLRKLIKKHRRAISRMASVRGLSAASGIKKRETGFGALFAAIPTLKEVLTGVPYWLGINIEIKYPHEPDAEGMGYLPQYEMNAYLDTILKVVFEHANTRRIIFSCFHPDVCIALLLKQARFPVMFLTCGGIPAYYNDVRCNSMEHAFVFALREHLQGIVINSDVWFQGQKDGDEPPTEERTRAYIKTVKDNHLLLFSWGNPNSHPDKVELQREWGLDGVICDNVGDIVKARGKKQSQFYDDLHDASSVDELLAWKEQNGHSKRSRMSSDSEAAVSATGRLVLAGALLVGALTAAALAWRRR